jgi:hypothetical protein
MKNFLSKRQEINLQTVTLLKGGIRYAVYINQGLISRGNIKILVFALLTNIL